MLIQAMLLAAAASIPARVAGIDLCKSTFEDLRAAHGGGAPEKSGDAGNAALRLCYELPDGSFMLWSSNELYLSHRIITDVQLAASRSDLQGPVPRCTPPERLATSVPVSGVRLGDTADTAARAMRRFGKVRQQGGTLKVEHEHRLGTERLQSTWMEVRTHRGRITWMSLSRVVTSD